MYLFSYTCVHELPPIVRNTAAATRKGVITQTGRVRCVAFAVSRAAPINTLKLPGIQGDTCVLLPQQADPIFLVKIYQTYLFRSFLYFYLCIFIRLIIIMEKWH